MKVSPGFTPRPSLSESNECLMCCGVSVSPGFTPRPSLSEVDGRGLRHRQDGVAGVHASAFVERG